MSPEPTFDNHGYPTEETLKTIEEWKILNFNEIPKILEYVYTGWNYKEWGWSKNKRRHRAYKGGPLRRYYHISTGGWSGNESLISAMENNHILWSLIFVQHRRGGHYIFEIPE